MVGWQGTLKSLSTILYDNETKTVNMSKAFSLFGLRGAQAAAVVVKSFVSGDYQKALSNVYEIGTAEEMAAKQAEGLAVKLKNLIDRAGNVAVAFGEAGAANAMRVFLDGIREVLAGLETFVGSVAGQVIVQLTALAGAFKLVTVAANLFMVAIGKTAAVKTITSTYMTLTTSLGKKGLTGALTTAAYVLEVFLKKLNPITIALGLVAAAVLTYQAVTAKSIKDAEQVAVKNLQVVDSLQAYQGAMVATGEKARKLKNDTDFAKTSNDAYLAILKRLIKAHPELASAIELSIDAYEKNNKVVSEFADAAHVESIRSLVNLYNEYGEAGERAKVWAGVWEETKYGLSQTWDALKWVVESVDELNTKVGEVKSSFAGWLADVTAHIPVVGGLISSMFKSLEEGWKSSTDAVINYFKSLGEGTAKSEEFSRKQREVIDSIAASYTELGEKASLTYFEMLHDLQDMTVDGKKLSNELVYAILESITKSKEATSEYTHDVRTSLDEMNSAWKTYYDTKDIAGQFDVQNAWERLQKQGKDYADFLLEKVKAGELTEKQMLDAMNVFWAEELQGYKAKEDKETETLSKSLEKRQAAYQKFADKIKAIEDKLSEDKKKIRQADMTDEAKMQDDMIAARAALAEALKLVSEAETLADREEALKKLETARELYRGIADSAISASTSTKKATVESTETAVTESKKQSDAQISDMDRTYDAYMEALTRTARAGTDENARRRDEEDAQIAYMTEQRDELARKDVERIKKTFGENSQQVQNYVKNAIQWYGEEEAARILGQETVKTAIANANAANVTSTKEGYGAMKTEATNAIDKIIEAVKNLKDKSAEKTELSLDTKTAVENVEAVEKPVENVNTIVKDGKTYVVDTTKSVADVTTLETKATTVATIIDGDKTYKMDATGAIASSGVLKTSVENTATIIDGDKTYKMDATGAITASDRLKDSVTETNKNIVDPKVYKVDTVESKAGVDALGSKVADTNKIIVEPKVFKLTTTPAQPDADDLLTTVNDIHTAAAKPATVVVNTGDSVSKLNAVLDKLQILVGKTWTSIHTITVNGLDKLKEAIRLHAQLAATDTTSTHTIKVDGEGSSRLPISEKIAEVNGLLDGLGQKAAEGANYVVDFIGRGSAEMPISDKIAQLSRAFDALKAEAEASGIVITTTFDSSTIDTARQSVADLNKEFAKLRDESKSAVDELADHIRDVFANLPLEYKTFFNTLSGLYKEDFFAFAEQTRKKADDLALFLEASGTGQGELNRALSGLYSDDLAAYKRSNDKKVTDAKTAASNTSSAFKTAADESASAFEAAAPVIERTMIAALNAIISKLDELLAKLAEVANKSADGDGTFTTKTTDFTGDHYTVRDKKTGQILYRYAKGGPAKLASGGDPGGQLPGYGGGDTVPAMLESGEFVIRKEAVKKYGANLFENLNSMVAGMKIGGAVKAPTMPKFSTGGPVGGSNMQLSGQLHTINLNVNNTSHKLYGDAEAVNGLVKTLRREQLVTA